MQNLSIKVYRKGETNLGVLIRVVPWRIISINKGKQILTKDPYEDQLTYEHDMEYLRM